jgi:hypothetical protein
MKIQELDLAVKNRSKKVTLILETTDEIIIRKLVFLEKYILGIVVFSKFYVDELSKLNFKTIMNST